MDIKKKYALLTFLAIAAFTAFRFWYITVLPLSADEAYLWVCSRNLALSFYDTPPMAPFMIFISTLLFGNSEFAVRAFAAVFMALSALVAALLGKEISGGEEKPAFFSALLILIIPGFAFAGLLSGVEAPLVFFYLLSVYFLYRALIKGENSSWFYAGIATGLGFLSKYLILFIPLCLFIYLIFTEKRRYLRTPFPYIFLLTGLLISSPVIIWNAQNQWASFILNFFSRTRTSPVLSFSLLNLLKHSGAQAGILSPLVLIMLVYAFFRISLEGFSGKNRKMLFLAFFSGPVLIFFGIYSLLIEVPAPHWAGIGYLALIAGLPCIIHERKCGRRIKGFFNVSLITGFIITGLLHSVPYAKEAFLKMPVRENTKTEFESFLNRWPEKAGKRLGEIRESLEGKGEYFLIGRGFALASYLEFYNPGQERVYMVFQRTKVGHGYYFWQDINENAGKNAIFADENPRFEEELKGLFRRIERMDDYHICNREGKLLKSILFYDCTGFKGMEKEKPPVLRR